MKEMNNEGKTSIRNKMAEEIANNVIEKVRVKKELEFVTSKTGQEFIAIDKEKSIVYKSLDRMVSKKIRDAVGSDFTIGRYFIGLSMELKNYFYKTWHENNISMSELFSLLNDVCKENRNLATKLSNKNKELNKQLNKLIAENNSLRKELNAKKD